MYFRFAAKPAVHVQHSVLTLSAAKKEDIQCLGSPAAKAMRLSATLPATPLWQSDVTLIVEAKYICQTTLIAYRLSWVIQTIDKLAWDPSKCSML